MRSIPQTIAVCLLAVSVLVLVVYADGASIVGSSHDLSTGTTNEVCVFCHTPHYANPSIGPLWNRNITNPAAFTMYSSPSLTTTPSAQPTGISMVCLSCHDGVGGSNAVNTTDTHDLRNAPGHGGIPDTSSYPNCEKCHTWNGGPAGTTPGVLIGANLTDDHPISMSYPTAQTTRFNLPPDLQKGWNDVRLFSGKVECPSCHDPHDPSKGSFLRKSNAGSALCYTCHIT